MWVLIVVSMFSPVYGLDYMSLGTFESKKSCYIAMENARTVWQDVDTNEALVCLEVPINGGVYEFKQYKD